jgi:catechol 2,3-dioxygenase-like lactoylglutathione lyase family enzyme
LTELMSTPGVRICSGCARWAARRASRTPDLRRVARRFAHDAVGLLTGDRRGTFRSAIPILPSADLDRTVGFWRPIGFEVVERFDGYLVTHADGVELHFTVDAGRDPLGGLGGQRPGSAFVHVQDALALWKRLGTADVAGVGPVEEHDHGLREFVVTDPDGNRVRFGSPIPVEASR